MEQNQLPCYTSISFPPVNFLPTAVPLPGHLSPAVLLLQRLVQTHSSMAHLGCNLHEGRSYVNLGCLLTTHTCRFLKRLSNSSDSFIPYIPTHLSHPHGQIHIHHKHHLEGEIFISFLLRVQSRDLRFGFVQTPPGLPFQRVPVDTKASLWAPRSPAC